MPEPSALATVAVSFVLMEAVTYLEHRFVMHRFGMRWHRSHHRRVDGGFELNDLYPLISASVTMVAFAAAFNVPGLRPLLPVCVGVTLYGAAYAFVHDVYIHRRVPWFTARIGVCERLKEAHRVHHLWGGEPYGMLLPVVPAALRERAARVRYDPFPPARPAPDGAERGSPPPQVPVEA